MNGRTISATIGSFVYDLRQLDDGSLEVLGFRPRSAVDRAASLGRAVASRAVQGPLPPEAQAARLAVCSGCPAVVKESGDRWFCSECECPSWRLSVLQSKAAMPAATCPRLSWP